MFTFIWTGFSSHPAVHLEDTSTIDDGVFKEPDMLSTLAPQYISEYRTGIVGSFGSIITIHDILRSMPLCIHHQICDLLDTTPAPKRQH